MMKKTRKMLSLLLALVLCMAMAVPASAAGEDSGVRTKTTTWVKALSSPW